eukprot:scaffold1771_cov172-Amphora_coffeaeformis.AAC.14
MAPPLNPSIGDSPKCERGPTGPLNFRQGSKKVEDNPENCTSARPARCDISLAPSQSDFKNPLMGGGTFDGTQLVIVFQEVKA